MIRKGSWIEVEHLIYVCENLPVKIFIRGICLDDCEIGEETEIKTITGHKMKGIVVRNKPFYNNACNLGKGNKEVLMITKKQV